MSDKQVDQLQCSHAIHAIIAELLQLVVNAGGHIAWENPPSSLALREEKVQQLFTTTRCEFVVVRACSFGVDLAKKWLFATTWPPLIQLGQACTHVDKHKSLFGKAASGEFNSVASAVYPEDLAVRFASLVGPLLSPGSGRFVRWLDALGVPPVKQSFRASCHTHKDVVVDTRRSSSGAVFPVSFGNPFKVGILPRVSAIHKFRGLASKHSSKVLELSGKALQCACRDHQNCHADVLAHMCNAAALPKPTAGEPPQRVLCPDGGGLPSSADWRRPPDGASDVLKGLRRALEEVISQHGCVPSLLEALSSQSKECPFKNSVVAHARGAIQKWLKSKGVESTLEIRPGQPFLLDLFSGLLDVIGDVDRKLPSILKDGVPTGVLQPIPASGVWRTAKDQPLPEVDLAECTSNWKSADDDVESAMALVQDDIRDGFVRQFEGSLEDAKKRWPAGVAVGKLGIAHAPGRAPRLIMDSTVAGVNPAAVIEEKVFLPSIRDVVDTTDPADPPALGFSMDVSKAHKRVLVKEDQWGLLLFGLSGKLYHYISCHFGATFSAYWWGRVGSALHRLLHFLLWAWHVGLLYVDD